MVDPVTIGGAGVGGGLIAGLLTFFGMKGKVEDVDKRVDRLTDAVQFSNVCEATHKAVDTRLQGIEDGIKELLRR